jgi:lysozyme family protein
MVIEGQTKIPWDVVACIHSLESDLSLKCHLHNGDPLREKTVNAPKGRPKNGKPPFTWVESAIDALGSYPRPLLWDLGVKLYFLESYNGMGYKRLKINSPYLWSMTDAYDKGKFIQDGKFDPNAVSKQIGAVPLLKVIAQRV